MTPELIAQIVEHAAWPLVVLILAFVFRPRRYSDPTPGPSGQTIRHDRRKDCIEIYEPVSGKWRRAP
jgi:hypothetical protein